MPCTAGQRRAFAEEIESVCDELASWEVEGTSKFRMLTRKVGWITRSEPIPVVSDWSHAGASLIEAELDRNPDVTVFDFPHSAILAPGEIKCPSLMFTHNIEAEIFKRHLQVARSFFHKWLWRNQYRKMVQYEKDVLCRFDTSIAVSTRDCEFFREQYGVEDCRSIPTGVNTDFFDYKPPTSDRQVVFCGSMDWLANVDGMEYFHKQVWPLLVKQCPDARMKVVGRNPPKSLVSKIGAASPEWEFSGFVDDVREHVQEAAAFVIPLRVGGGTRIKAFEAMAMGTPVVSTSIGIEGLPVEHGEHFLRADTPAEFANSIASLLADKVERRRIADNARVLVVEKHGSAGVARIFEEICLDTMNNARACVVDAPAGEGGRG